MAGFEGVKWATKQMQYILDGKKFALFDAADKVYAVSRSIHYAQFLCFEGIRFFCKKNNRGNLEIIFLNWNLNLERFQRGIAFCMSRSQQNLVPSPEELENIFIHQYFRDPSMLEFLGEMADLNAQGYFRPFTVDEEQSIGVTFATQPSIRAVACRYDRYLGEPFSGVVVPNLIRAVGANKTGCLKLGVNYLMSVKAIDEARKILPDAASALFLDDRVDKNLMDRAVTEWDSSCCLFAFRDGTVVKIPESPLILPSVTIQGLVAILKEMRTTVQERDITYGELLQKVDSDELVCVSSVGTAGIMNRCDRLLLVDEKGDVLQTHRPDKSHDLYRRLDEAKTYYWDIYREREKLPDGMTLNKYTI
ncbi:MAG: aminotransferase class IV [Candidatus Aminicenantes bacterium]|jgi:branched-subunit amino acid aminotransferase/4-amino-4-deoxychorismate lyase